MTQGSVGRKDELVNGQPGQNPQPVPMTPLSHMSLNVVDVNGARITYRRSGPRGRPPLVLIHGGAGHMGWWFGVAPDLAERHDVAVVDLSGHGDSQHRQSYSPIEWANEVGGVIEDLQAGPAIVIAHSMGGHVAALLASTTPRWVKALILIDSRLDSEPFHASTNNAVRFYPTREDGLANFRLRPRGTSASPELLQRVAEYGLRETAKGWRWKFDPDAGQPFTAADIDDAIGGTECPIGIVYGELSELASDASADYVARRTGRSVPRVGIPHAYHHVPLDAPKACVGAIEDVLAALDRESVSPRANTS